MPYTEDFSYTSRQTTQIDGSLSPIEGLIRGAKSRLQHLNIPPTQKVDESRGFFTSFIRGAKDRLGMSAPPPNQNPEIQAQLDKINSLKLVIIPTQDGDKRYYSMADNAGGVTEKTCLIDEDTLIDNLRELALAENVEDVKQNKIRMNAILKHPKAEKDTEVQREAIGLKIAKILGFAHVTDSTMVSHDTGAGRHPCLFVPFGNMQLLTDSLEHAESMQGRLKQEHFSSVEDFGKYSSFFMLCSDPDFIGKAGQNKGLTGEGPKKLYLFDQVFMADDSLGFNPAFNLVPTRMLSQLPEAVARHFMGRNKSIINDSSFEEKIQSAIEILKKKEEIRQLFADITQANPNMANDPLVKSLRADAEICLRKFEERALNIERLFPAVIINDTPKQVGELVANHDDANLELVKKSMLLTQLINKPKLFDPSGKPYRAPFFNSWETSVQQISIKDDKVTISFGRAYGPPLSDDKKALLAQQGFTLEADGKSATISKAALLQLNEQNYFKEQENTIAPGHNYLDPRRIEVLAKTYGENSTKVQQLITNISNAPDKVVALQKALNELDTPPLNHRGFAAHIKQCFLYEAMKVIIEKNPAAKQQLEDHIQQAKQANQVGALEALVHEKLRAAASAPIFHLDEEPRLAFSSPNSRLKQSTSARFAAVREASDSEDLGFAGQGPAPITQEMRERYRSLSAQIRDGQLPTEALQTEYDALEERLAEDVLNNPELLKAEPVSVTSVVDSQPRLSDENEPVIPRLS